jgi:hypothetical protein
MQVGPAEAVARSGIVLVTIPVQLLADVFQGST